MGELEVDWQVPEPDGVEQDGRGMRRGLARVRERLVVAMRARRGVVDGFMVAVRLENY